jgi:hypothetical protein
MNTGNELIMHHSAFIIHNSSFLQVVPDGVEPSFPGCGPSVVAVGPRDRGENDEIQMTNVEGMSKLE